LPAIANLPRGSLVIVRSRNPNRRRQLAHAAARIAQRRGLSLSIANDVQLAAEVAADGLHLSEAEIEQAGRYRSKSWLITAAAHSAHAVLRAHLSGAHAVLLSPIFATQSHKERTPLGLTRLRTIARTSPIPIYALGGIDAENVESLKNIPLAGIAAIGALLPKQGNPNRILREAP
jgi:thiamine-phosphate pyrophosphorylase